MSQSTSTARREFLKFLAASPCVAALGGAGAFIHRNAFAQGFQDGSDLIADPAKALSVFDFEEAARRKVLPGHWSYTVSGVDNDGTLRANREGFQHVQLRPRFLRDPSKVDTHVDLFGATFDSPIFLCPTGSEKTMHPDGELAVARAAKTRGTLQILANPTSTPVEEVNGARGRPVWFQLYAPPVWSNCQTLLRRVEAAGCTVLLLTVDVQGGRNSETDLRTRPKDLIECNACHEDPATRVRAMDKGFDRNPKLPISPLDWAYVDRIRQFWKGKFVVKGIVTREDAALCIQHGVDAIYVSNHGGRGTEMLRSTIESLPEVVAEVKGRVPVFCDSGFRRGTDVFKALALGAKGVGIGRPFLWGLGAFGQAGVDRVIEILQSELRLVMRNCGTRTVADITRAYVATPDWKS